MLAARFGLLLLLEAVSAAPLNLPFLALAWTSVAAAFVLQTWLYVRWGSRIWALAFSLLAWQLLLASWPIVSEATSESVLGGEEFGMTRLVEIPTAVTWALRLSVPVLAVFWTLFATRPQRAR
ncbi:MAG: hypothetical protein R3F34_20005 [Planctomycetota bacterium]